MKTSIFLCLVALLHFPVCRAQCDPDISILQLVRALYAVDVISEPDPIKFTLQNLTYLCFVRSSRDSTRFSQVRVSFLYTYESATDQSAQATFTFCLLNMFRFTDTVINYVTQDPHLTGNMTTEDCQDCQDNSTFARPTFCRREYRMGGYTYDVHRSLALSILPYVCRDPACGALPL